MKVIPLVCIAASLLIPTGVFGQSKQFTSVPSGSWTYAAYNRLVTLGYAKPWVQHQEFSSKPILTRYEFAVATDRLVHGLADKKQSIKNRAAVAPLVGKLAKEFRPEINLLSRK